MLENREEELTTVRVQDPRVHNEGSWNSYVDYKIFLHTNSKAFTAKTSCVRRRYREFAWLRRQLQKNAGLVPVPELPGKSAFFVGSSDEFIERRRQGLQQFLERVLQSAVLLPVPAEWGVTEGDRQCQRVTACPRVSPGCCRAPCCSPTAACTCSCRASCPWPPSRRVCRAAGRTLSPRPSCTTPWDTAGTARGWPGDSVGTAPPRPEPAVPWTLSPTGGTLAWTRRGRRAPSVRPDSE
ncbi:sorting nexin-11-like isoform X2 [Sylvia atricapilla]|uniref:sorting nexin-11-like isoform X2 n=1 Tax=Sylvia atricapilla TaxID=48155 RepID=UPI003393433A